MDAPVNEWQRGWREARWGFYFSIALLPGTLAAVMLAYVIQGPAAVAPDPSPLAWILCLLSTLCALFWAGYKDGLESWIGVFVWTILFLGIVFIVGRQMVRGNEREHNVSLTVGDRQLVLNLNLTPVDEESPVRVLP